MAKRGQLQPFRMRYEWPGGVAGTTTHTSLDAATFAAEQQARRVGPTGDRCTVTVTHRDRPAEVLLRLEAPAGDEDDDDGRCRRCGHMHDDDRPCLSLRLGASQSCNCPGSV